MSQTYLTNKFFNNSSASARKEETSKKEKCIHLNRPGNVNQSDLGE